MTDGNSRSAAKHRLTVVVPLAGPDFERADGTVKAELLVDGKSLLAATLETRPWWGDEIALIFVLKDSEISRGFAANTLLRNYPHARIVWLSHLTGGAAFSAAAGLALATADAPIVVDLCDIIFDTDVDPVGLMAADDRLGGLAMTFTATNPQYSYLRLGPDSRVVEAREKVVISSHASAGVYIFRDAATFFEAIAHSVRHRDSLSWKGILYVCPMFNGVLASGLDVRCVPVENVQDIKLDMVG